MNNRLNPPAPTETYTAQRVAADGGLVTAEGATVLEALRRLKELLEERQKLYPHSNN